MVYHYTLVRRFADGKGKDEWEITDGRTQFNGSDLPSHC